MTRLFIEQPWLRPGLLIILSNLSATSKSYTFHIFLWQAIPGGETVFLAPSVYISGWASTCGTFTCPPTILPLSAHSEKVLASRLTNDTVQCSAVQCSAVQCSAVQCSALQCRAMHCTAVVQCSALQRFAGRLGNQISSFASLKSVSLQFGLQPMVTQAQVTIPGHRTHTLCMYVW